MKKLLKANPSIVCREEEGDALLFNPENGRIKLLNRAGYEIWSLCNGTLTLEKIAERLGKEYPDTPVDDIKKDVSDFVTLLEGLNLIEKTGA